MCAPISVIQCKFFFSDLGQYFQVGLVGGGISECGDKNIPSYFTRLDHPEIANFITSITSKGKPSKQSKLNDSIYKKIKPFRGFTVQKLQINNIKHKI